MHQITWQQNQLLLLIYCNIHGTGKEVILLQLQSHTSDENSSSLVQKDFLIHSSIINNQKKRVLTIIIDLLTIGWCSYLQYKVLTVINGKIQFELIKNRHVVSSSNSLSTVHPSCFLERVDSFIIRPSDKEFFKSVGSWKPMLFHWSRIDSPDVCCVHPIFCKAEV